MDTLEITYRRNAGQSYMILPQEEEVTPFEEAMLKNNDIPVLLPFFSFWEEGRRQLWYDITGKKSVRHYFEQEGVKRETVCPLFLAILDACRMLEEYLISEAHIVLQEDTLYLSGQGVQEGVFLCFSPNENEGFQSQLCQLYEYLMPQIEAEDEALVSLVYEGYGALCDGSFSMEAWENAIRELLIEERKEDQKPERSRQTSEDSYLMSGDWEPEEAEPAMDWEEDEDEEEHVSLIKRAWQTLLNIPGKLVGGMRRKKEDYFPPKDLEEDLIYNPGEALPAPTVLLTENNENCFGRLVYEGAGSEQDYVLDQNEYRVGSRDEKNEILLHSSAVSRHHARIWKEGEAYYLEDLNSTNGTYVNGETVNINDPVRLESMDRIHFADVEYRMV